MGNSWQFVFKRNTMITYTEKQATAIRLAATSRCMILTGGPGTGKTTTLSGILSRLYDDGYVVRLCAPTGRAAQRMKEQTGRSAETIHRLLQYTPGQGFRRDRRNPVRADVLIVDEASMIDIELMQRLTDALPDGARLIIVGDHDQLPSVGAGNVLRALIQSGVIPTVTLTQIQRQAEGSLIIQNAHRIIHGQMPLWQNRWDGEHHDDFLFQRADSDEETAQIVTDLVARRLPAMLPDTEIQVLTPMKKDGIATATASLNTRLQREANPDGTRYTINGHEWRQGDRVIQTRNDYDLQVMNGDLGRVTGFDPLRGLLIDFSGRTVALDGDHLRHLQLAYAITIHKSQGSEFPVVVIPLTMSHAVMLRRNLFYTAVTRARQLCIIVGSRQALERAVRTEDASVRNTRLEERMRE